MSVSEGHRELTTPEEIAAARTLDRAWTDPEIARQQRALADRELERWRAGEDVAPFRAYVNLLRRTCWDCGSLLDVGCGAGYYRSVLAARGWYGLYFGLDFSEEMIAISRAREPEGFFRVGDARALPYGNRAFPIVVSGCSMLHLADDDGWIRSIAEAARVATRYVMLHKTPVAPKRREFRKAAYGVECFERWFGAEELARAIDGLGLRVVDEEIVSAAPDVKWISFMLAKGEELK